ncbi:MAG: TlpA disulfide reductase family protein [Actinomycetota bacterium]
MTITPTDDGAVEGSPQPSRRRRVLIVVVALALVVVATTAVLVGTTTTKKKVYLPSITLASATSSAQVTAPFGSRAHRGKATVLVFFASWCEPCKRELPNLANYLEHHSSSRVAVIGVDGREENRTDGPVFARSLGFNEPLVEDPTYRIVSGLFNLPGFPDTVFIGADGEMVERHVGPLSASQFAKFYQQLAAA